MTPTSTPSAARLIAVALLFLAGCAFETLDRRHALERASIQNHHTHTHK